MNNEMKKYFEQEYKNIYKNLYIQWTKEFRNKQINLSTRGLTNSGIAEKNYMDLCYKIINDTNKKIENLINYTQKHFNRKMKNIEVKNYIKKSIQNNNNYIDTMKNDLSKLFKKSKLGLSETTLNNIINLNQTSTNNLNDIGEKVILVNNGKNETKKMNFWEIFALIIGFLSLVVGVISCFI